MAHQKQTPSNSQQQLDERIAYDENLGDAHIIHDNESEEEAEVGSEDTESHHNRLK